MSKPISNRSPAIYVEYDSPKGRVKKLFEDSYKARRFYCDKLRAGKNPKVLTVEPRSIFPA